MHFDAQLWAATKGFRPRIAAAIAIGFISLALGIVRFVILGWLIARLFEGAALSELAIAITLLLAAITARMGLEYGRAMVAHGTAARIQDRLRLDLYDQIVRLGPAWLAERRTGSIALSTIDGVEQLQTFFGQFLPQLAIALLAPILLFAILSFWDVPVAAVISIAAILALILPVVLKRIGEESTMRRVRSFKAFGADFLDAVQGLPTLKSFGQGAAFGERLARKAHQLAESTLFVLQASLMSRALTDLAIAGGAAAAIALGAWRVRHGEMSIEALLIVLMAGTEVFRPLRDLRSLLHRGMVANAAAVGIKALLEAVPPRQVRQTDATPQLQPSLSFDDVRFRYSDERGEALKGISFEARAGERIGIVGYSGSGKSTIVKLLLRFYDPDAGTIRIGGQDVTTLSADHVRDQIAVVQQDTYLFYGTVEENIRIARPDATGEQVEAAARAANAHGFITALPQGYGTIIGERGQRLSGGQRQRIAIARAVLRDAPILVLDEALSSVDAENESIIQAALDDLAKTRTTIVLAHRLSSVIDADRIIVVADGRIADSGTHAALIGRDGPYRQLMAEQIDLREGDPVIDFTAAATPAARGAAVTPTSAADLEPTKGERIAEALTPFQTLATLFGLIRPWRRQLLLTVGSGVGRVYALIGVSILSALTVAAAKAGTPFGAYLGWMAALVPLAAFLQWNESWRSHDMAYRLLAQMRVDLYKRLEKLAPAYLLRRRSGDLVSLGTQDVETVEYFFAHVVAPAMVALTVPLTVLAALAFLAWPTALVLLPFLAYAALAPVFERRKVDTLGGRARSELGGLNAFVVDTVQGLGELIALRAIATRRQAFQALIADYRRTRVALNADLSFQAAKHEAVAALGSASVLATAALLINTHAFEPALLPLVALLSSAAFVPVSELAQAARQLADSIASTRRIYAVHAEPVAVVDGPNLLPAATGGSSIAFSDVTFSYDKARPPVLESIDFAVPAGARVAVVGSSGAGKTTIANLLLRFWDPQHGRIAIDGLDLRDIKLDSLREHIALVAQDTHLFNASLAENIRIARPDASADDLQRAIARAALGAFVASLPAGLETNVGERGVQLSGGQRQRIAIARAFLKNAPILILDEATSHLDAASEAHVRRALDELMVDRTTIVIAHRLSTIRSSDAILVMRDGHIVERGTHRDLMHAGGFYAELVRHQAAGSARGGYAAVAAQ
ncbi:ABC transporter ATP-binding protein/permease [Chelatococcus asaccharovorans]|uniref:ABC transporter ATP-binding protein/permease n=1 Tax=Chelatococcus asaccharovorans TaxID=28210 RepID=UPI00224C775E|nr:ABC transporter ATP-binding protein [Chelatococcus asaccharovorans]CAH1656888.1 Transport ATP-binding protein CydCD [Chelatococcus asaccharovorans]CAH1684955.1 Transport ATP-binding protein CydCD [Chelatococcus asaccharovorans]